MIRLAPAAAALALMGCTAQEPPQTPPVTAQCDPAPVQQLVGQDAAQAMERAKQLSGANSVRVYKEDDAITMDYRADRINLVVDDRNEIQEVKCG